MDRAPKLLQLPYELRLEIYDYLIPLDQPCDSLMGLLLSCRQIGRETEDVMFKEHLKITKPIESLWSSICKGEVRFPYPGRLYSHKELVIEVPYLTDYPLCYGYGLRRGILIPPIRRIAINIVSSQNPPEDLLQCSRPSRQLIFHTGHAYLAILGQSSETSECNDQRLYGRVTIQFKDKIGLVRRFERRRTHYSYLHGCFHTHHAICTENSPLRVCD